MRSLWPNAELTSADLTGLSFRRCHNIYLVLPQFLITALSSIIFALFAPGHSVVAGHGAPVVVAPIPTDDDRDEVITGFARVAVRQATEGAGAPDTLGIIFRQVLNPARRCPRPSLTRVYSTESVVWQRPRRPTSVGACTGTASEIAQGEEREGQGRCTRGVLVVVQAHVLLSVYLLALSQSHFSRARDATGRVAEYNSNKIQQ